MATRKKRTPLAASGEVVRRKVHGDAHVDRTYRDADEFMMMFNDVTDEFCWGTVWARPALGNRMRSALSLGMTAAQSQTGAVKLHVKTRLRQGWTPKEIGEILLHAYVYAGVYASLSAFTVAKEAIAEFEAEQKAQARGHPVRSKRVVKAKPKG